MMMRLIVICMMLIGWFSQIHHLNSQISHEVVFYVNPTAPYADDANDGTYQNPLKTIQGAFDRLVPLRQAGVDVRIILADGIYREALFNGGESNLTAPIRPFWMIAETTAQITIEAERIGGAIISGADVWTDWQPHGQGIYTHHWQYDWGVAGRYDQGEYTPSEYASRRELVILNHQRLTPVTSYEALTPNTFWVDEASDRLFIHIDPTVDIQQQFIEVGVRDQLLYGWNRGHFVLRGLVFQHSVDSGAHAAVAFQVGEGKTCEHVVLEDVTIRQNAQVGLYLNCHHTTLRRVQIIDNGFAGVIGTNMHTLLVEDSLFSGNGWRAWRDGRGQLGVDFGWSNAAMKLLFIENALIRNNQFTDNWIDGLWFDTDNRHITIENNLIARNRWNGLFLEASYGPFIVRHNRILSNGLNDVVLSVVQDVLFESNEVISDAPINSLIYDTQNVALFFGEFRRDDAFSGLMFTLGDITLRNNTIVATNGRSLTASDWLSFTADDANVYADYRHFIDALTSNMNVWVSDTVNPFRLTMNVGYSQQFDFDQWRMITRQDGQSQFCQPDGC
ncbi:MAG: hypothetical protein CUN52_01640 [Phototrophicales bacterium]|nr:MAG: hypothetical protein CUN52_01640 [Phototrophicales bacterium]